MELIERPMGEYLGAPALGVARAFLSLALQVAETALWLRSGIAQHRRYFRPWSLVIQKARCRNAPRQLEPVLSQACALGHAASLKGWG